ncbi:hypothetical protein PMIN02_012491 [Paraphaeosphaeria minitans]|uniref:Uncharacterized protein n=1 Tax=Paraphaeosphaeria minitans TaxID=565426 RepID=A0A9P6GGA3_9PLEO|nr:hypothetical protein PMIN01_08193 [Paraphaeosphaeria minitans]
MPTANGQGNSTTANPDQSGQSSTTVAVTREDTRNHEAQNSTDTNSAGASRAPVQLSLYLTPHEATEEERRMWDGDSNTTRSGGGDDAGTSTV